MSGNSRKCLTYVKVIWIRHASVICTQNYINVETNFILNKEFNLIILQQKFYRLPNCYFHVEKTLEDEWGAKIPRSSIRPQNRSCNWTPQNCWDSEKFTRRRKHNQTNQCIYVEGCIRRRSRLYPQSEYILFYIKYMNFRNIFVTFYINTHLYS